MKRLVVILFVLVVVMAGAGPVAVALQGGVVRGPIEEPRDPELEKESLHHLEVARFYFKKKNWVAVRSRLQQIVANNPNFSAIAEVYYMLGEVYARTNERDLAVELFSRLVEEFPQSDFTDEARARLQELTEKASQELRD